MELQKIVLDWAEESPVVVEIALSDQAPGLSSGVDVALDHTDALSPATLLPAMDEEVTVGSSEEQADLDLGALDPNTLTMLVRIGAVILTATGFMLAARGGNYKVVRIALQQAGKTNKKQPLPEQQRKIRRRKRRTK